MSLSTLKKLIAEVVEGPSPEAGTGLTTGVPALDTLLAWTGVPRGRVTEIVGTRGSGKTTLVRMIVEATINAGLGVAYIDAERTLWAGAWSNAPVHFVRPPSAARGAWCADVLLRSGAFSLVVLDGAPMLTRALTVRLTGLARDSNAALVILAEDRGSEVGGAVRLRAAGNTGPPAKRREASRSASFYVRIEKGGTHATIEVSREIRMARRLCAHSEVPDRRGVAPSQAERITPAVPALPANVTPGVAPARRVGTRSRRCAEARVEDGIFERRLARQ